MIGGAAGGATVLDSTSGLAKVVAGCGGSSGSVGATGTSTGGAVETGGAAGAETSTGAGAAATPSVLAMGRSCSSRYSAVILSSELEGTLAVAMLKSLAFASTDLLSRPSFFAKS